MSKIPQIITPVIEVPKMTDQETEASVHARLIITQKLGIKIIQATGKLTDAYFSLCTHIREDEKSPLEAHRKVLHDLGFAKSRISEIIRVSQAPDEVWSEYNARLIGFNKALEAVRGGKATTAGQMLLQEQTLQEAIDIEPAAEPAQPVETAKPTDTDTDTDTDDSAAETDTGERLAAAVAVDPEEEFTRMLADLAILAKKLLKGPRSVILNGVQIIIDIYEEPLTDSKKKSK